MTLTAALRAVEGTDRGIRRASWPGYALVRVMRGRDEWELWTGEAWTFGAVSPGDVLAEDWEVQDG